jgi:hypothetical protein
VEDGQRAAVPAQALELALDLRRRFNVSVPRARVP